jgi:hypothetical protein
MALVWVEPNGSNFAMAERDFQSDGQIGIMRASSWPQRVNLSDTGLSWRDFVSSVRCDSYNLYLLHKL